MRAIAILLLAVLVCVLLVCAARLVGKSVAERDRQRFEQELDREAQENIKKAHEVREQEKRRKPQIP
jgi:predicted Holliday junction resolvase-like endonuclease